MLEMGFREPPVSGVPQPNAAYAVGQRPFDAGSRLRRWLTLLTADPRPSRLRRLVLRLRGESHAPSLRLRPRAACPRGTPLAVFERTLHEETSAARLRAVFPPVGRPLALGAAHALVRPIARTGLDRIGPVDLGLPPRARPGRAASGEAILVLALDEPCGTDGGGVDQVRGWGQVFLHQRPLERRRTRRLRPGGGSRVHRRHQVRGRGRARCTDVHHRAGPRRITLVARARRGIIGRFDALSSPWDLTVRLEPSAGSGAFPRRGARGLGPFIVALPGPAPRRDAGEGPNRRGSLRSVDGIQDTEPSLTHSLGVGRTCGVSSGEARLVDPLAIALIPFARR
jgi:hypothetical protein